MGGNIVQIEVLSPHHHVTMFLFISSLPSPPQEGRTALHYAAALQGTTGGVNQLYSALVEVGADENVVDVVRELWKAEGSVSLRRGEKGRRGKCC